MPERLRCAHGGGSYTLRDRIEWGTMRGDVIDISLFTTTLLEVGPGGDAPAPTL